jgi:hypothetical protein
MTPEIHIICGIPTQLKELILAVEFSMLVPGTVKFN